MTTLAYLIDFNWLLVIFGTEGEAATTSNRHSAPGSMLDDNKKIGIGLCGIGVLCVTLGIFLLFDRTLLALGNVAFLFGLALLLGPFKAGFKMVKELSCRQ